MGDETCEKHRPTGHLRSVTRDADILRMINGFSDTGLELEIRWRGDIHRQEHSQKKLMGMHQFENRFAGQYFLTVVG